LEDDIEGSSVFRGRAPYEDLRESANHQTYRKEEVCQSETSSSWGDAILKSIMMNFVTVGILDNAIESANLSYDWFRSFFRRGVENDHVLNSTGKLIVTRYVKIQK
jgi:hypothetical protein